MTNQDATSSVEGQNEIVISAVTLSCWIGMSFITIYAERNLSLATYYRLNFNVYHIGSAEVTAMTFIFAIMWILFSIAIFVWLLRYLKGFPNHTAGVQ